jgi:hypothetical protein
MVTVSVVIGARPSDQGGGPDAREMVSFFV